MKDSELDKVLAELVEISKRYGKNPGYGSGGSAAQKECGVMYISDANKPLAGLDARDFIKINRNGLNKIWDKDYPADDAKRGAELAADIDRAKLHSNDYRHTGEYAPLHNLFDYKYTLYIHPPLLNALTCADCGKNNAARLIGSDLIWVSTARPGYELLAKSRELVNGFKEHTGKRAKLMLIQNHGALAAGDTPEDIDAQMLRVMSAVEAEVDAAGDDEPLPHDAAGMGRLMESIAQCYHDRLFAEFTATKRILKFMANDTGKRALCAPGREAPNCRPIYMTLKEPDKLKDTFKSFVKTHGYLPRIICIPQAGAVAVGSSKNECRRAAAAFESYIKTVGTAENFGGFLHLTDGLISYILNYNTPGYAN